MTDQKIFRERLKLKSLISDKTGYYIRSNCLLFQAFTRSSYSSEYGGENNEILEFIGDQVLGYYVVRIIAEKYGAFNSNCEYKFRIRENRFTELKQLLVSNNALSKIIDEWGISDYLLVGKSDEMNKVTDQVKVKADLFEAIIGVIAVSSNWDASILEKVINKALCLEEKLNDICEAEYRPEKFSIENAIMTLKELAEHGKCSIPIYDFGSPEQLGHDEDGNPIWCCTCRVVTDITGITRQVWASSKKVAKKAAAYLVLCELLELQNEYGPNSRSIEWTYKSGCIEPGVSVNFKWSYNKKNSVSTKD